MSADQSASSVSEDAASGSRLAERLRRGWRQSVLGRLLVAVTTTDGSDADTNTDINFTPVFAGSRLQGLTRRAETAVRGSFLYRWLTAEPDPEVIVIDLRETWTVGPFIQLLDRIVPQVTDAYKTSQFGQAASASAKRVRTAPARVGGLTAAAIGVVSILAGVVVGLSVTAIVLFGLLAVGGLVATQETRSWDELRETRPVELLIAAFEPPDPPESADSSDAEPTVEVRRDSTEPVETSTTDDESQ